jgi:hypothetical protein
MFRQWTKANIVFWEKGFAALCKFRAREGHCCPSPDHVEDSFRLGGWVVRQRERRAFLPLERERRLDAIGFVWVARDNKWEQGFMALLDFKRREGHCRVPHSHVEEKHRLGQWVATQREKRETMSAERKARLNKIGFVWRAAPKDTVPEASCRTDS